MDNHTDCRSDVGITTGLIDAMISICRVLKERDLTSFEAKEALKDFKSDDDSDGLNGFDDHLDVDDYSDIDFDDQWN